MALESTREEGYGPRFAVSAIADVQAGASNRYVVESHHRASETEAKHRTVFKQVRHTEQRVAVDKQWKRKQSVVIGRKEHWMPPQLRKARIHAPSFETQAGQRGLGRLREVLQQAGASARENGRRAIYEEIADIVNGTLAASFAEHVGELGSSLAHLFDQRSNFGLNAHVIATSLGRLIILNNRSSHKASLNFDNDLSIRQTPKSVKSERFLMFLSSILTERYLFATRPIAYFETMS